MPRERWLRNRQVGKETGRLKVKGWKFWGSRMTGTSQVAFIDPFISLAPSRLQCSLSGPCVAVRQHSQHKHQEFGFNSDSRYIPYIYGRSFPFSFPMAFQPGALTLQHSTHIASSRGDFKSEMQNPW